ncbi:SpdA protein, partial [Streptomyces sp. PH10-H1]|nr:SpdA protein [Streptomyces sp. PH10-H1]
VTVTRTTVTAARPPVPGALLTVARRIADKHHADEGEPITPGQLKTRLGVTLPLATAALEQLSA